MKELVIINHNGVNTTDSRNVAEMVGKNHKELMRDIRTYLNVISTSAKLRPLDFFIENTYKDKKGEIRPCYLLTKQGCEMVANKMTGEKGILFTAEYVQAFNNMEQQINLQLLNEMKLLKTKVDNLEKLLNQPQSQVKSPEQILLNFLYETYNIQPSDRLDKIKIDATEFIQYTKHKKYHHSDLIVILANRNIIMTTPWRGCVDENNKMIINFRNLCESYKMTF